MQSHYKFISKFYFNLRMERLNDINNIIALWLYFKVLFASVAYVPYSYYNNVLYWDTGMNKSKDLNVPRITIFVSLFTIVDI